jgi:tetratricopeptide (TPR) repeat protein
MNHQECIPPRSVKTLLCALLVALVAMAGCANPEKAKNEYLRRGEAYLKESRFQEASIEFRNAIQIDERFAAAHWGLALAYEGLQRFPECQDELKRTIDLDANHLDSRVKLANYYLVVKPPMLTEAERLANEVLQKNPDHIEGIILRASVMSAQNRSADEVLAEINRAIRIDPRRVESYLSLARFYITRNDPGKAEEAFRRAISLNEASALAHTQFGKYLAQANRAGEAEAELKRGVEVEPTNRESRLALASFYLSNRQLDKAEEAYKALADLDRERPDAQSVLADFYATIGRLDDAVRIYNEILTRTPDYTRGHYRMGEILLERGDTRAAAAQAEMVLKQHDNDRQSLLLRARVRLQTGATKDAVKDLEEVLKQEPNSRSGLYFMAEARMRAGQIEQARGFAGELHRYYPDYLPGKLMQMQINFAAKDPKTVLTLSNELLEQLAKSAPDLETSPQLLADIRAKALTARGLAQLQLNNVAAARADLTLARDQAANSPAAYVNLARVELKEGKTDEAISLYERALAIDSVNYDALNGLVNIYARQNRTDQSHARIDQAIGSQPGNRDALATLYYLKAQVYVSERNTQNAEAELRRALDNNSNYLAAYFALGALFANASQQERAIAEYRRVIERKPDDVTAYTLIGMIEDSRGNYDAAVESYRKALELDQNSTIAANNLAWLYANSGKGNLDEAQRLAQGVVQKFPDEPGFVDTLGWVYFKKGLYPAAVEQLKKAIAREESGAMRTGAPPSPVYRFHLGMALAARGDKAGARKELEAALTLAKRAPFGDADEARKTLATL